MNAKAGPKLTTKLAQIPPPKRARRMLVHYLPLIYPAGPHAYNRGDADADMMAEGAKHTAHLEL